MAKNEAKWSNFGVFSATLSLEFQKRDKFTTKKAIFDVLIPQRHPMAPKIDTYLMKLHSVSFKMVYSFTSKGPEVIHKLKSYFWRRIKIRHCSPLFSSSATAERSKQIRKTTQNEALFAKSLEQIVKW